MEETKPSTPPAASPTLLNSTSTPPASASPLSLSDAGLLALAHADAAALAAEQHEERSLLLATSPYKLSMRAREIRSIQGGPHTAGQARDEEGTLQPTRWPLPSMTINGATQVDYPLWSWAGLQAEIGLLTLPACLDVTMEFLPQELEE